MSDEARAIANIIEFNGSIKALIVEGWNSGSTTNAQQVANALFSVPAIQFIARGKSKAELDSLLRRALDMVMKS